MTDIQSPSADQLHEIGMVAAITAQLLLTQAGLYDSDDIGKRVRSAYDAAVAGMNN